MAKSENQKVKILYVMKILMERTDEKHGMTMQELIDALAEYEISAERKSLYSDIQSLQNYGIDIEKQKTNNTYQYFVASRSFELPELKLLVDAVQSSKFITHKKSEQLIKKVESLSSCYEAQSLQRQVYVHNRIKTMNESIYYNVDKIQTAIAENKKISYLYFEWQVDFRGKEKVKKHYKRDGARYMVSPWGLTWDDENYYMIGYDTVYQSIRHYRVDKMADIKIEADKREGQDSFSTLDMALYSRRMFGMFGGKEETVSMRFHNELIGVVLDRFGKDIYLRKEDENHFVATLKVTNSPLFLAWIFGLGTGVKILSPSRLQSDFMAYIKEVQSVYVLTDYADETI